MQFEHTRVMNFEGAFRGMRNPKNSWHLSDSNFTDPDNPVIGPKDLELAQNLIRGGGVHRKFMRQIFVSVDITAPDYFWKEFSTYKIGTVENSTSTMHKIHSAPISETCFEMGDYEGSLMLGDNTQVGEHVSQHISFLERLRKAYMNTKDKKYWKELIRWTPMAWLYRRTVTMNYENLLAMCSPDQRRHHKLSEWSGSPYFESFVAWARTLPYAQELIFLDELDAQTEQRKLLEREHLVRKNALDFMAANPCVAREEFADLVLKLTGVDVWEESE